MTKLEKQKEFVRNYFSPVMRQDGFGHFKHGKYRIKMQKICFRFELNTTSGWLCLASVNYKDANDKNLAQFKHHITNLGKGE